MQTGTWYDIGWSVPFLVCAIWASQWKEVPEEESENRAIRGEATRRGSGEKSGAGAASADRAGCWCRNWAAEWRGFGFFLVGVSITCYVARLSVIQYREGKTAATMRRQTVAMDSAMDGIAIVSTEEKYTYVNEAFARMMGYAKRGRSDRLEVAGGGQSAGSGVGAATNMQAALARAREMVWGCDVRVQGRARCRWKSP